MRNKIQQIALLVSLILILNACSNEDVTPVDVPDEIISQSLNLFPGTVIEEGMGTENGRDIWEIKIQNTQGAIVEFYWAVNNQLLIKIEGDQGPFTYDIKPGLGLINFSAAKTFAVSAVKNDAVLAWELEQNEDFIDKWVYEFEIADDPDVIKVYVDGETGDVLQID
jgi:uncharacterized membrane protein YkoI